MQLLPHRHLRIRPHGGRGHRSNPSGACNCTLQYRLCSCTFSTQVFMSPPPWRPGSLLWSFRWVPLFYTCSFSHTCLYVSAPMAIIAIILQVGPIVLYLHQRSHQQLHIRPHGGQGHRSSPSGVSLFYNCFASTPMAAGVIALVLQVGTIVLHMQLLPHRHL
jgi:hypothetical protein